ncbi:xanthine dehydrogenase family protein molybdopterin-binding subunit [Tissierellaceae bacterium HCP3S3_D8]
MQANDFNIVGKRQEKIEARQKATGALKFSGDLKFKDMLHCRILRSPYANAIVKNIDTSEAFKVKGVVDIITHEDVPKILSMHQFLHVPEIMWHDSYILEKHVRHVGDRVAAVAATSVEIAEEALKKIKVEYDVLPAALTAEEALKPDAPKIHEEAKKGKNIVELDGNILDSTDVSIGDTERGFAEADYIIEREYRTSKPNPAPMERTCVICVPADDGRLDVYATSQGIHAMRINMSHSLGIPVSMLNCHRMYLGGSFGAHIHTGFIENICALLALRTGRPVRGEKTREEIFLSCGRHPMIVTIKAGFKKDGTMTSLHSDVIDDTGAYAFSGSSKMNLALGTCISMYRCPNMRITGKSVYTNTPPLSAMRGAGNPQGNWAIETMMDEAAQELGIDPVELRYKNNVDVGDTFYGQGPAVKSTIRSCGTEELLDRSAEITNWYEREKMNHTPYPDKPWIRKGLGMARGFHTSGCGSEKPNAFIIDHSAAYIKMNEDGTAQIMNSAADLGSGVLTAHAAIAAEIIGLKYEDVMVNQGDTDTTPFDGATHASRGLYGSGQPIVKCAEELHSKLLEWGSRIFQCGPEDLEIKDSRIYIHDKPEESIPISEVVCAAHYKGWGIASTQASMRPNACPPHFITVFVELEVNTLTGMVNIVNVLSGVDTGTIINLNNVEGQVTGGFHMGMGYALMEDMIIDDKGQLRTKNFSKYHIPTVMDMPEVDMIFADTYEPTGPLGAKAIGEGVTNPVAAAIGNAINNAVGIRIRDLPCTPEKIVKILKEEGISFIK